MQGRRHIDFTLGGIWIAMGLLCKVLGLVPRHGQIVAEILGNQYAATLTFAIGVGEIFLGIWVASGFRRNWSAGTQITLVMLMNILEITFAVNHLLWGPLNLLFAILFCIFVYWNGFLLHEKIAC